jgi:CelD/BcsL family acetyltransferase involved in cellulose biosynthesis
MRAHSIDSPSTEVEFHEDLDPLRGEWAALAERSRNVFLTPEWADLWRAHYAPGSALRLLAVRDAAGELRAVWPIYLDARGPVRVARLAGHGPADELGPACDPADRPLAGRGLRAALAGRRLGAQALVAERLAADLDWPGLLSGRTLHREASPVIPIGGRSWEDYLAAQSRNFREQAGRRRRKLEREHAIEIAMTEDPGRLGADLDTLVALHEQRWAGGESDSFDGVNGAFHRAFAAVALERGWLRLWILRADGEPVAAWHGFRFGGVDAFYQSGRNPAWDRASVGFVLMAQTVRLAFEDGMAEYRLLRGEEGYKGRWAAEDRPVEIVVAAATPLARPAIAAAARLAGSRRLRQIGRRALAR